jgi:hypothetical protein
VVCVVVMYVIGVQISTMLRNVLVNIPLFLYMVTEGILRLINVHTICIKKYTGSICLWEVVGATRWATAPCSAERRWWNELNVFQSDWPE